MDELRNELWDLIWGDIKAEDEFPAITPLLAHYTSASTLDAVFKSRQLWLSHPMLMNDLEELQWGINAGIRVLQSHKGVEEACGSPDAFTRLNTYFAEFVSADGEGDAYSIFVSCFCECDIDDNDGLLSMWRAYGANGGGAAIVLDTSKLLPQDDSPFLLSRVRYGSGRQREDWISKKLDEVAGFLKLNASSVDQDFLSAVAFYFLARLRAFALTTKHAGFSEEREWRLIYLPERDLDKKFSKYVDYMVGPSGFQPKMKLPLDSDLLGGVSISSLVSKIMLGPAHEAALGATAVRRMLVLSGHEGVAERVVQSMTPFRPMRA